MAKLVITTNKSVKELKEEYHNSFGTVLRVYNGRCEADETATLSELGVTNEGTVECRGSLTVGAFISRIRKQYGLKVKVFTPDNWVSVLDGISLAKAASLKKQISRREMENYISYKKHDYVGDKGKKSVIAGDFILEVKQSGHIDVVRVPRNAKGTMKTIAKDLGYKIEEKWTTQDLGRHLVKEFGDGTTAVFGDITITKNQDGKIEIVEIPHNTKDALEEISQQIGFAYNQTWTTQTFGKKLIDYLIENKDKADKILKAPNMKRDIKCTKPEPSVQARNPEKWEVIEENDKFGFKDENGEVVIPCIYDSVFYSWDNGFRKVKIDEKVGFIDCTGKVIVPIEYDSVYYLSDRNFFIIEQGGWRDKKIGVMSTDGKVTVPLEYNKEESYWLDNKCLLIKDGGSCLVGNDGVVERILPYDCCEPFDDITGLALVRRDGKWGYVNKNLEEVVACENQYYILCVTCNPYMLESIPMDEDALENSFEFLLGEYEENLEERGLSMEEKLTETNIGEVFAITARQLFQEYGSEHHSYLDEVEEISLIPIPGKDWWEEYRACEQDDIVTFCPEEADIEYSDYSVKKDCITAIYKRASYACGLFYRLIIKGAEEFDPSKLKVSNPVDGSDYWDTPDAFYDGNQLVYLGNGFDDNEFEYSTARLFWDGEEIELPEMDNGYDDKEEDW